MSVLKRFVVFNPGEILTGPYGPAIWTLSFSWVLTACLFAAVVKLALVRRSREALAADTFPRRPLVFLLLAFAGTTYALTRYETFVNVRYLLAIAPLLILVFAVAARVLLPRPALRYAFLSIVFLLLLASDFRTIDPVSRRLWGTFPFGRHQLLKLTSWNNECCGYARDQLVYNLEYLKMHEIQNIMFADLRPTAATKFLAHPQADFFLAGRVTPEGTRTLGLGDTLDVHYGALYDLDARRVKPERVYFVAFPNFDNGPDLQRLRRTYSVASVKSYERSGYAIPVYTMRRRAAATPAVAVPGLPGGR